MKEHDCMQCDHLIDGDDGYACPIKGIFYGAEHSVPEFKDCDDFKPKD